MLRSITITPQIACSDARSASGLRSPGCPVSSPSPKNCTSGEPGMSEADDLVGSVARAARTGCPGGHSRGIGFELPRLTDADAHLLLERPSITGQLSDHDASSV